MRWASAVAGISLSALAGAAMGLCGCSHGKAAAQPAALDPVVELAAAGAPPLRVQVELARTPAEQQHGLMDRAHLDDGRGMLFLFGHPRHLSFWMHHTYIPLDMIFITSDHKVAGVVENAEPLTDDARAVDGDTQFVLEVPGGWSASHHVAPGTDVKFIDIEPPAVEEVTAHEAPN